MAIAAQIGLPAAGEPWLDALRWGRLPVGTVVGAPKPLSPRLEAGERPRHPV